MSRSTFYRHTRMPVDSRSRVGFSCPHDVHGPRFFMAGATIAGARYRCYRFSLALFNRRADHFFKSDSIGLMTKQSNRDNVIFRDAAIQSCRQQLRPLTTSVRVARLPNLSQADRPYFTFNREKYYRAFTRHEAIRSATLFPDRAAPLVPRFHDRRRGFARLQRQLACVLQIYSKLAASGSSEFCIGVEPFLHNICFKTG